MPRYKLTIEYDGRPYKGFQYQADYPTVQGRLETALRRLNKDEAVVIHASGRTDAGVHARGQVIHVDLPEYDPFVIMQAMNFHLLPEPIVVLNVERMSDDFHARFSCKGRRYFYRIINRRPRLALEEGLAWHVIEPLDVVAMHSAAQRLLGTHDFTSFRSTECQSKSPIKTLEVFNITRTNEEIHVHVQARSFLHHQVRNMVGSLRLIGNGKWQEADLVAALDAKSRAAAGENAPPYGLYFMEAYY